MSEQPQAEPEGGRDWDDAACVVNTASEIQDAATALCRDPLSQARADQIQALLADPGVGHARRALARLVDGHSLLGDLTDGRW
ncbi:hypothetical protein [Nocardia sp. IFM 10818]